MKIKQKECFETTEDNTKYKSKEQHQQTDRNTHASRYGWEMTKGNKTINVTMLTFNLEKTRAIWLATAGANG